jgi:glucose-6-phosphate 1-dehydrogenase
MRYDQVLAAWQIIMPVLDAWSAESPKDFPNYKAGSWGPEAVNGFFYPGQHWQSPTELDEANKKA